MTLADRDDELAVLRDTLTDCLAGNGGVVVISGVPASGKTALLQEFSRYATESGAVVLAATASPRERAEPLGVVGELLAETGATRSADSDSLPRFCREFRTALLEFAGDKPLVVLVDDVQHSDLASLECLLHAARRVRSARILVVLTENTRLPREYLAVKAELSSMPHCRQLRLDLLSLSGVRTLLTAANLDGTPVTAASCHQVTGGNPLLVQAFLEDCQANRTACAPGEAFRAAVSYCLYRGDPAELALAQALAVLGPDLPAPGRADTRAVLGELLGLDVPSVGQALGILTRVGLVRDHLFRHETARTVVLETLLPAERAALSGRAARVLHDRGSSAMIVARHLIAADEDTTRTWAVPVLEEAAEQAMKCGQGEQAVGFLHRAREISADEREQARLTAELAKAEWRFAPARGLRYLPDLVTHARHGRLAAPDVAGLCRHLAWHGQLDQALEVLDAVDPNPGQGAAATSGDLDLVRRWLRAIFPELAGPARVNGAEVDGVPAGVLGPRWASDMLTGVLAGDHDVLAKSEQVLPEVLLRDEAELASSMAAVVALVYAGKLESAASWCQSLVKESEYQKAPGWQALLKALQAIVQIRQGRMAEAEASAEDAVTLVPPPGWGVFLAMPLPSLLLATTAMGKHEQAARYLRIPVPDMMFRSVFGLQYLRARGGYYLATDRHQAALADFQTCGQLMTAWELDLPTVVPWRTDAAQALIGLGKLDLARDLVYEQLLRCPAGGSPRGVSLRVLAITRAAEERLPLLRESIGTLDREGDRYELTLAVAELAKAHRELGDDPQAAELTTRARHLAAECGVAVPLAAR
ncbi:MULTISPECIES: AAA family ATPase [unclassified Crossiella]|uniref:AAA family ATPase n=1 Tax=unclassified Crossiella TaxID=2620835 RepID=UPI001FFF3F52|nr:MULTISPECIES: ATP-binding protein [unclassified Crossiella]MCK2244449.1 ATP-binding protein [Crossiella sp. S99.2]MCK2258080.1 ATP-binding protein [Crossiella sp. S99.1]